MKITTPTNALVAEGLKVLKDLARYGAWVEPVESPGERSDTLICGKDNIYEREHEVAGQFITSLEGADLAWLFGPETIGSDPLVRVSQAWARALLPSTHSLHAPLSLEDKALLEQHLKGDQNHGQ